MFRFYLIIFIIFNLNQLIIASVIKNFKNSNKDVTKNNYFQDKSLSDVMKIDNQLVNNPMNKSLYDATINGESFIDDKFVKIVFDNGANDKAHLNFIANELKIDNNNSNNAFTYFAFGLLFMIIMLILVTLIEPNICIGCNCPNSNDFLCVLLCCECFQGCAQQ